MFIFIFTIFTLLIGIFLKKVFHWKLRGINGPLPLPFLGTSLDYVLYDYNEIEKKRLKAYGKTYGGFFSIFATLITRDPELVKIVTSEDYNTFGETNIFTFTDRIIEESFVLKKGEPWKKGRNLMTPVFTRKKINEAFFQIEIAGKSYLKNIQESIESGKQDEIDVKNLVKSYALDVIAKFVFAVEINSFKEKNHPFVVNVKALTRTRGLRFFLAFTLPEFVMKMTKFSAFDPKSAEYFYKTTNALIKQRWNDKKKYNDFLDLYFNSLEEKKLDLNVDEVISNCIIFFFAGMETVAVTVSLVLYNLATHSEWQEKLYDDLKERYKETKVSSDNLNDSKLLDAVVKESLRIYPATNRLFRVVQKDCTLRNYELKAGEVVSVNVYGLHMDEDFWEEPEKFNPFRFMEDNPKINDYYMPFGNGPRFCPGQRLALAEVKYFIINLLLNYKIYTTSKTDCPPNFFKNENAFLLRNLYLGFEKQK